MWSNLGNVFVLAVLLLLPAAVAAQQVTIDGVDVGEYYEHQQGTINNATVNEGLLHNHESGTINNVTVSNGGLQNGSAEMVEVPGPSGEWWDYDYIWVFQPGGTIHNATVNGGYIGNYGGWMGNANVNEGSVENIGGTIQNATVNEGSISNSDGWIGKVTGQDAYVSNGGGWIGNVDINGGSVMNYDGGTINELNMTAPNADSYMNVMNYGIINQATISDAYQVNNSWGGHFGELNLYNSRLENQSGTFGHLTATDSTIISRGTNTTYDSVTLFGTGDMSHSGSNGGYGYGSYIGDLTINGEWGVLNHGGTISRLEINNDAFFVNYGNYDHGLRMREEIKEWPELYGEMFDNITHDLGLSAHIGEVELNNGTFWSIGGLVSDATVNGGIFYNGWSYEAPVDMPNMPYGVMTLMHPSINAMIENLTVTGGNVVNQYDGHNNTITKAEITGGHVLNEYYATMDNVTLKGGTLENQSPFYRYEYYDYDYDTGEEYVYHVEQRGIRDLTYVSGTYNATFDESGRYYSLEDLEYYKEEYGQEYADWYMDSITPAVHQVILAGDSAQNTGNWGIVENVSFHEGGDGVLTIAAYGEAKNLGFVGLQARDDIDFTTGYISLDITGVDDFGKWDSTAWEYSFFDATGFTDSGVSDYGFFLSDIFTAETFTNVEGLVHFGIGWGDETFWILSNMDFSTGWQILYDINYVQWDPTGSGGDVVPEPATLAVLGLGLAGLGLTRARMRRRK